MTDMVNHPAHYKQYHREVIELTELCDFCTGNALKYILRAPFKGKEIEDLKKARWYINRLISTGKRPRFLAKKCFVFARDYDNELFKPILTLLDLAKKDSWYLNSVEQMLAIVIGNKEKEKENGKEAQD